MAALSDPVQPFRDTEVWLADLVASGPALHDLEARTPRLSAADEAKCSAMSDKAAGRERRAAHIALRVLAERAFGTAWRGVTYDVSAQGKLSLPGAGGSFSLSHIPGWALIGISDAGAIGVDLERRRPITMSAERRRQIEDAASALATSQPLGLEDEARFLQAWVRLEAVSKASGLGMGPLLTALGVTRSGADRPSAEAMSVAGIHAVHDLGVGEGRFAAVAVAPLSPPPRLLIFPASPENIEALARH